MSQVALFHESITDPMPLEPDDEKARLEREFIEAAKSMQAMAERLTRLGLKVA